MDPSDQYKRKKRQVPVQPMQIAWNRWADNLSDETQSILSGKLSIKDLTRVKFSIPYAKYDNLLLISRAVFSRSILAATREDTRLEKASHGLWKIVADVFGVGHVAVVAPIPIDASNDDLEIATQELGIGSQRLNNGSNVLRSPVSFQPLYGDFGPEEARQRPFTTENAEKVFWAKATQFKVVQIWSPLHTMFSQGNIKEKERILKLEHADEHSTAVDLYAGIGYFAFCYRKQVASTVLGWEINPWSVEGFRRGAEANGWRSELRIVQEDEPFSVSDINRTNCPPESHEDARFLSKDMILFAESNARAYDRVRRIRDKIPPVRHVNCGFLPTSEPSWETAIKIIDPLAGGCVRVHENIAISDIQTRADQIVERFRRLAGECNISRQLPRITCSSIARVKTYAPGVMHCVVDIQLAPEL